MRKNKANIYNLQTESGTWLGQVVLTTEGSFMSITDWGNFCYHWGSQGEEDFREFLIKITKDYFAGKMYQGIAYMADGRKVRQCAERFADNIFPALQQALKDEIASEKESASQQEGGEK